LIAFLRAHPERTNSLFDTAQSFRGIYDKQVLQREGDRYVSYWQDHGARRDEEVYHDLFEAVADWLPTQYGMWLRDEV